MKLSETKLVGLGKLTGPPRPGEWSRWREVVTRLESSRPPLFNTRPPLFNTPNALLVFFSTRAFVFSLLPKGLASLRVRMLDKRTVFSDSWVFDPGPAAPGLLGEAAAAGSGTGSLKQGLPGASWTEQQITGMCPPPRRGHTATMVRRLSWGLVEPGGGACKTTSP